MIRSRRKRSGQPPNCHSTCKCDLHQFVLDKYKTSPNRTYNTETSHDYSKKSLNHLISLGLMSDRARYICNLCIDHGKFLLSESPVPKDLPSNSTQVRGSEDDVEMAANTDDSTDDAQIINLIDTLIERLVCKNDHSDSVTKKVCSLAAVLGTYFVDNKFSSEYGSLQHLYKDVDYMKNLDSQDFLAGRNQVLLSFLRAVAPSKDPNSYQLAMLVENVYHIRNNNLVLPHSFMTNLIQTFISGSKTVTALNGKLLAGGSDTTYRIWLRQNAEEMELPSEDSDIFVDNVGHYVVKSYRVSQEKNAKPNVVTASINIPWNSDTPNNLQQQENLKPGYWGAGASETNIQRQMVQAINESTSKFLFYKYRYIFEMFKFFDSNHADFRSQIDAEIARINSTPSRKCESCSEQYTNRKRICDKCGGKVSKVQCATSIGDVNKNDGLPKYLNIGQKLSPNHTAITMGKVIPVNPNSYENMELIMTEIFNKLILSGTKKWVSIGADGPPYTLMRRLIEESGYDWVVLTSGLGHLNMNQLKTFFAVAKHVCFGVLGKDVLNFNTSKAFDYFISCKDTHKSWESLEIFLHGTAFEFIRMYIEQEENPTPHGFLIWERNVAEATQRFLLDFTFKIALSIYVQRIGDRNNDAEVSHAGRMTFLGMFFAFNHPVYREVEYNELRNHVITPKTVKKSRDRNHTFTESSGASESHQGGDFMLEQRVKRMKMLSPKGVMSTEMWERVSGNVDSVGKIVKNGMSLLNLREDDQYAVRFTPIEKEIVKWCAHLRQSQYLYTDSRFVVGIDGNILNAELKNFMENLDEYRHKYFQMALETNL